MAVAKSAGLFLALAFVAVFNSQPILGQSAQPPKRISEAAPRQQFSAWLAAFNRGKAVQLESFLRKQFPSFHDPVGSMLVSREATGGYDLLAIESSGANEVTGLVRERDWPENFSYITVITEPEPPGRIREIELHRAPRPDLIRPPARMSEVRALSALAQKARRAGATGLFSGAMLVARDGEPLWSYVAGKADLESGAPIGLESKFRIGSMNKMFTSVAVLQLMEEGKISLTEPISTYLPDYPNVALSSRVTAEHLLTHTGGTGDIFGPQLQDNRSELRDHADYLDLFANRELSFAPGERYAYSNYGFILLGALIEAVSGKSYYDYVRENVFLPAGMHSTDSLPEVVDVPGRTTGYTTLSGAWTPITDTLAYRGTAAGGGYSTVGDLIRFSQALRSGVLLDPRTVSDATTRKVEIDPQVGYGYGFYDIRTAGIRSFGHGGAASGMDAQLFVFPESGYAVAVAANRDAGVTRRLADFIRARLPIAPPAQSRTTSSSTPRTK